MAMGFKQPNFDDIHPSDLELESAMSGTLRNSSFTPSLFSAGTVESLMSLRPQDLAEVDTFNDSSSDGSDDDRKKGACARRCCTCETLIIILIILFSLGAAASFGYAIYYAGEDLYSHHRCSPCGETMVQEGHVQAVPG